MEIDLFNITEIQMISLTKEEIIKFEYIKTVITKALKKAEDELKGLGWELETSLKLKENVPEVKLWKRN